MGKRVRVILGDEVFDKKGDVAVRIRELIKSYPLMGFLIGKDKDLCLNLFKHHPNYQEKSSAGILEVQVRMDEYGNRNFHIHKGDKNTEVISWPKCLQAIQSD